MGLAWLLVFAAAALAVALFLIRPRPPRRVVSSLAVWQRVLDEARDQSLWDRIRWWVSLAVTAAIAAALAAAVVRPTMGSREGAGGRLLVVLDSSWSMRARTPSGPSRWDRALAQARALVASSSAAEVAIATTAEGLVEGPTSDRVLIRSALDRITPSGAAEGAWPRVAGGGEVHFFTDGSRPRVVPPDVIVHTAFVPAPNVAVTAFDVQASAADAARADAFVAVANHATTAQPVRLVVTRGAEVVIDKMVPLAAGASHNEVLPVPVAGEPRFRAQVAATENALEIDDDASAWLAAASPLAVGVVGEASVLPRLLAADPSLRVLSVHPEGYAKAQVDVWVFDRWLPNAPPAAPALIVDPPASSWLGARAGDEADPVWRVGAPHEILDGVDIGYLDLARAHAVARPALQAIASSERGLPLVSTEDGQSGRFVVLGFSTVESNLASTPAFPVLVGNAVDWLGRPARGVRRLPGPMILPAATSRVLGPDGRALPLTRVGERVVVTLTSPGLYRVDALGTESVVAVALGDPRASNLLVSTVGEDRSLSPAVIASTSSWGFVALAALLLVLVEWVTWQRRVTV